MTSQQDPGGALIELSTVYFFTGSLPKKLSLRNCSLAMAQKTPGLICGLYGRQSKQEGFMAAHAYAERHKLEFTVIDFLVRLQSAINPVKMAVEDLPRHDFLSLNQLRKQTWDAIAFALASSDGGVNEDSLEEDGKKILLSQPELISRLCEIPEYQHFRVLAFDGRPNFSEHPLQIGTVPVQHWDAIESAVCRLNPATQVTLEYPSDRPRPAYNDANAPVARPRETSRMRG